MTEERTCRFCEKSFDDANQVTRAGPRNKYCSDHCRKEALKIQTKLAYERFRLRTGKLPRKEIVPEEVIDKFCPECGKRLVASKHKWCSLDCRETAYRKARKKVRLCKNCTSPIPEERRGSPYCSVPCYLEHSKCVLRDSASYCGPSFHEFEPPPPGWLEPMREGLARLLGLHAEIPTVFGHACGLRGHCDPFATLQRGLGETGG